MMGERQALEAALALAERALANAAASAMRGPEDRAAAFARLDKARADLRVARAALIEYHRRSMHSASGGHG